MAKVKVKYLVEMEQIIHWPDDEMDNFDYSTLQCNCEPDASNVSDYDFDIKEVTVNGTIHEF